MHSSIDLEALSGELFTVPNRNGINQIESANQILERLRRRVGQLYGTTDRDHTLSQIGLILITLEACIARLGQGDHAISQWPSLSAIIDEIDKCLSLIHI